MEDEEWETFDPMVEYENKQTKVIEMSAQRSIL